MKPVKKNITQKQNQAVKSVPQKNTTVKPAPSNQPFKFSTSKYFYPAIIVLLCLVLYGNTWNGEYTEDDGIYTKENVFVKKGFSDVSYLFTKGSMYGCNMGNGSSYRPLVLLTFMAETSFFGLNPHVFQRFNIFYFALCCLAFFFFVQKAFAKYNPVIPLAAAALFIFHPIHTDAVANFKSRDEILTLMFGLLSFYLLLLYNEKKNIRDLIFSVIAFACSLLCKETSVSYLLIFPLVLYFFTADDLKTIGKLTLPYIGVIVVYLILRERIFGCVTSDDKISIMNNGLMAAKNTMDMYATTFTMLGKYLYLLFVPYPLSWDYSYPQFPIVSWSNIGAIAALLIYIGLGVLIIMGFKKKSVYSFSAIFYLATLFLTSNLVLKIACSFGERFLFSPSVGFCMAMPILLARGLKLNPLKSITNPIPNNQYSIPLKAFYSIIGAVLVIYAFILIPRNSDWHDDFTLFKSGVKTSPNSGRAHGALASMYMDSATSHNEPAIKSHFYFLAAEEFKRVTQLFTMDPDGYYNLGVCLYGENKQDSAIPAYKKALELSPGYSLASNNLGVIYFNKNEYEKAIPCFELSLKGDSNNVDAIMNIGASYQNEKNYALAFHYDSLALKKAPDNKSVLINMSILFNDIGMQYVSSNDLEQALQEFTKAMKCDTNSANAVGNLGVVYQRKGNLPMARNCFQKALAKDPKNEVFERDLQAVGGK